VRFELLLLCQAQRMLQWTWTSHTAAQHHCLALLSAQVLLLAAVRNYRHRHRPHSRLLLCSTHC
jgi:hypothetical protein